MEIEIKPAQCGVVFDFDGTLEDSYTYRNLAHIEVANILADYGEEHGEKINRKAMVAIVADIEREMTKKQMYDRKVWFFEAAKRYGKTPLKIADRVLSDAVLAYWNTIIKHSSPYPGTVDLLASLKKKGFHLGIVSDTDGIVGMKNQRLRLSGLFDFFDAIVVSGEDTKETKPDKNPFIRICRLLNVAPTNCLYVGDNPEVDIKGARQINMKTILIANSIADSHNPKNNADYVLTRAQFSDLELLISRALKINLE